MKMMEVVACMREKTDTYQREALIELANLVLDIGTGRMIEYRNLIRYPKYKYAWNIYAANEFLRLSQGVGGRVKVTDTIYFLNERDVPQDRFKDV